MPMKPVDDSQSLLDSIKPEDYGGPREEAGVRGMKNELSTSAPAETDGSEVTASPSAELGLTKTWFVDNFGMSSAKISEILIKAEAHDVLEKIQPLIIEERKAIVKQYEGVDPEIVNDLPLQDVDYAHLGKNSERLRIPFLQLAKAWTSDDQETRDKAYNLWRNRIDKSARLSTRENQFLSDVRSNV